MSERTDRFKFRVWDNMLKKYDRHETLYLEQQGGLCYPALDSLGMTAPDENSEYIIEQCTGLRDKNGTLIYEGDKLSDDEGIDIEILFADGKFCFNLNGGIFPIAGNLMKLVEVIGNIHEL